MENQTSEVTNQFPEILWTCRKPKQHKLKPKHNFIHLDTNISNTTKWKVTNNFVSVNAKQQ